MLQDKTTQAGCKSNIRRKAWLAMFAVSAVFWGCTVLAILHFWS